MQSNKIQALANTQLECPNDTANIKKMTSKQSKFKVQSIKSLIFLINKLLKWFKSLSYKMKSYFAEE